MLVPELWHIAKIFLMIHIHDTLLFQKNKDQPLIYGFFRCTCSGGGTLSRGTISAEWLRHFNNLAVGETAAPACFLRENAEGAGMPPLLSY
jgi:hypothetical protein